MANSETDLMVVGMGASAGGLDSLKEFFGAMPSDSGLVFVVIQHLDPQHVSYMADILAKCTSMEVRAAHDGMAVQADCVYTIPPNRFLIIEDNRLRLTETVKGNGARMPVDFFFRSLAANSGDKAIGLLLSGGGSDGTLGAREIHGAGGLVLVQEPATAQFDSMIQSALATGIVDATLPVGQIPAVLLEYARQWKTRGAQPLASGTVAQNVAEILDLLATHNKHAFQAYRKTTLWRRISRRMGLNRITEISAYADMLRQNPEELARLAKDLLIGVTSLFRDTEAFEELHAQAITPLVRKNHDDTPLRAWTVGCSTGEEAYSIAILIREEMARQNKSFPVQIFASDVASEGLKYARDGIYPESIAADVSEERLARYFVKKDGSYQVSKEIRESVTFAVHNVLLDPPFLKMDLISCRNLLIYIEHETQKRIHGLFAFALKPGGYLFLGKSENVELNDVFQPVTTHSKIYRRLESPARSVSFPMRAGVPLGLHPTTERLRPPIRFTELNQEILLKHFHAAVVLVNEHGHCLHFYGPVNSYLELPAGDATLNLFDLIDKSYSPKLRLAVRKAFEENDTVTLDGIEHIANGRMNITVSCCVDSRSGVKLAAVIFEPAPSRVADSPAAAPPGAATSEAAPYIGHLEAENNSLRKELQANAENFQATYEEFTSANEELVTMNEELQSTNEEMETAKEELQSVNEELVTVNSQINEKVAELAHTNDDLANFLNSTEVGTIFLDTRFCIRRFTPASQNLLSLLPLDIGRPIEHISNKFVDVSLTAVADGVLKTLTPIEKEVRTSDGSWYMMRCLPYRTLDNRIDGVILTFSDVTRLKQSEESTEESRRFAQSTIDSVRDSLLVLDDRLRVVSANHAYYRTFAAQPENTLGHSYSDLGDGEWTNGELRRALEEMVAKDRAFEDVEVEINLLSLGARTMIFNARRLEQPADKPPLILLAIQDYTDRKRAADILAQSELEQRHKADELEQQLIASGRLVSLGEITASMAHEFNNPLGIVMGFAEDLLSETTSADPRHRPLKIILDETNRCQKIIKSLMEYARPGDAQRRSVHLGTLIDTTLHMMETRLYKQRVTIERQVQPDLPQIYADPQQLEQVLVNVYLNALDVMPDGGTLSVGATSRADGARQECVIAVTDTGSGIDDANLAKIFQPFYTSGKKSGLGLGLPVCERIVKNHGGRVEVASQRGKGTTFKIYLPVGSSAESPPPLNPSVISFSGRRGAPKRNVV